MWAVLDLFESATTECPGPAGPNSCATSRKENKPQEIVQGVKQRNMGTHQELSEALLKLFDRSVNHIVTTHFSLPTKPNEIPVFFIDPLALNGADFENN